MIRKIAISLLYRFPFLTKYFLGGNGFVFMLHRILPSQERNKYEWNKSLAITPEGIEKWVNYFREKGYDFVSMDEVYNRLKKKKSKPFIAFTMDDGYRDNLTYGLPVFRKLDIPCTIYVSNCFPENKAIYWWYFLEDYVKSNNELDLTKIGLSYSRKYGDEERKGVYDEVREILRKGTYQNHLDFTENICGIKNLKELNIHNNLTWEEVIQLSNEPLVTIGGHTLHHVSLGNQSPEVCSNEILDGNKKLAAKIQKNIHHFAYPYGSLDDVNDKLFVDLKQAGIKTAVLNHPGSNFYCSSPQNYSIPRMGLTDETPISRIESLLTGKLHLEFNGLRKKIV